MTPRRFVIISGLSGGGKSVALRALEDAAFYCVDNLPAGFLEDFAQFVAGGESPHYANVAVGVDARNPASDLSQFPGILDALGAMNLEVELVFIEANDQTLINRFSETRRRHPLSSGDQPLPQAIKQERILMHALSERADLRLDTSHSNVHQFRQMVNERLARRESNQLSLQVCSFGFKNGVPPDADFVFDLRCLPNPYWHRNLREFTGRDQEIHEFLHGNELVEAMISDISDMMEKWIPRFASENRSYLTIALGCTGGRHRSIYVAQRVSENFKDKYNILVVHRDN
ncbi:MAG: RNase adapter RapZ [Gammaproteobacteria bacterium]